MEWSIYLNFFLFYFIKNYIFFPSFQFYIKKNWLKKFNIKVQTLNETSLFFFLSKYFKK